MTDTPPTRRAAPIAAVVLVTAASTLASWAAFTPNGEPGAGPVVATTAQPGTTAIATPAATPPPPTTAAATVPTITVAPSATASSATDPRPEGDDRVVLATAGETVDAWSPAGKLGSTRPCEGRPNCRLLRSAWADGAVVSAVVGGDGVTPRLSLVRSPLDGGATTTVAELDIGAWVNSLTVAGGAVWWAEQLGGGTPHSVVRRAPLTGTGPAVEVARDTLGFAPDATGRRVAVQRPVDPATGAWSLAVVDLDTGSERSLDSLDGTAWFAPILWLDDERLLVQGVDAATVIAVAPDRDPRVERTLPVIASCVDTASRIVGVQRVTNVDGSMHHTLAESDPATGRVTPWGGAELRDGTIACRGDGAVLAVSFADGVADTELVVARASGRRTVLGRGASMLASGRGTGSFSSMNCGPAGDGESGTI